MLKFKYIDEVYTPYGLTKYKIDQIEAKKEYQRLRKIALLRLKRLYDSGYSDTEIYRRFSFAFPAYSKINSTRRLAYELSEVHFFLNLQLSTVSGQHKFEEKALKKLHENGYDFVTKDNLKDFGNFMEWVRSSFTGLLYGSSRVADLYGELIAKGISTKELADDFRKWKNDRNKTDRFNYWLTNVDELRKSNQKKGSKNTLENYRKTIDRRLKTKKRNK